MSELWALLPVPTGRLALLAAAVAPVAAVSPLGVWPTLLVVNGVLLAVALGDAARAPSPRTMSVRREIPPVLTLDVEATLTWQLRNPSARPVVVALADALAPSLGPGDRRARLSVPAGGRAWASTTLRPSRRGRFDLPSVTLRLQGPLGLAARQEEVEVADVVRVYPAFRSREQAELRVRRAQVLQAGVRVAQGRGGGGELDRLREYRLGDEFRHIDWRATARTGKAIVRTYRAERNQTVIVLVDSGRTMAGQVALGPDARSRSGLADASWTVPRLDHAMDAAQMLTLVATRLGDATGLVTFADRVRAVAPPRARGDQLRLVTEALYPIEPVLAESDYRGAFAETLGRFRRRALLVVLTELTPEPMDETLLPALPLVLRDHLVMIAGVRDPEIDRWARAVPVEASAAFRKAAAVQALDERRRAASRLRGLGATVIDETPARLPGALADAYLDVKSTGRL